MNAGWLWSHWNTKPSTRSTRRARSLSPSVPHPRARLRSRPDRTSHHRGPGCSRGVSLPQRFAHAETLSAAAICLSYKWHKMSRSTKRMRKRIGFGRSMALVACGKRAMARDGAQLSEAEVMVGGHGNSYHGLLYPRGNQRSLRRP